MEKDKINPELRKDIALKMDKVKDNPGFYDERKKVVDTSLIALGDIYSFWIEHPELRRAYLTHNLKEDTIRKQARDGIRAITDGWYFLLDKGRERDFVETFDLFDLERLNAIVYREQHSVRKFKPGERFRKGSVQINARGYHPPDAKDVVPKLSRLFREVKEVFRVDPLEAAIYAHLGIASIQPFDDGNKRCARLVQNRILFDAGLPPSIIPAGEGRFYLDLFCRSARPYEDKDVEGQREFFDYNASKVNNALDEILEDLKVK